MTKIDQATHDLIILTSVSAAIEDIQNTPGEGYTPFNITLKAWPHTIKKLNEKLDLSNPEDWVDVGYQFGFDTMDYVLRLIRDGLNGKMDTPVTSPEKK